MNYLWEIARQNKLSLNKNFAKISKLAKDLLKKDYLLLDFYKQFYADGGRREAYVYQSKTDYKDFMFIEFAKTKDEKTKKLVSLEKGDFYLIAQTFFDFIGDI